MAGSPGRVLVVGAGIAGASAADHLARDTDASVVVLERNDAPAAETTAKSGAFVGFWGHEGPACAPLLRYGIRYYGDLLSGSDPATRYVHGGRLRVATTADGDEAIRTDFASMTGLPVDDGPETAENGAPVQYVPGDALAGTLVAPDIDTEAVTGALYSPGVGYVERPDALARAVLDRARSAGATLRTGTTVRGVLTDDGRVTGVRTDAGTLTADAVVAAAGPWNRRLLADAGVDLPVGNTRGPILRLDGSRHGLPALYHEESGVYTRQNRDGSAFVGHYPGEYTAASELDPDGVSDGVASDRRERCLAVASRLCPAVEGPPSEEWVGVRTLTPDGRPIAGPTRIEGLSVLAFNANGIQYAPAAGHLVAAHVAGSEPSLPTDGVALDRFDRS